MKTSRRNFIKTGTVLAAGSVVLPSFAYAPKKMDAGLQVYSVRNQLNEDFEGTMAQVAKIGYKIIEGYGLGTDGMYLGSISPKKYKQVVSDLGMSLKATHCSYVAHDKSDKMVDAALESGLEYLVVPAVPGNLRGSVDSWKKIADNFNKLGEKCKKAGLKFGYHNHAFEFEKIDGKIPQEILFEETEKDLVTFEADLFWVTKGGYDPVKLIEKYPGRISLFHVKDATPEKEGETVGKGIIDFKSIFKAGKKDALKHYFIEDERTDDPFANIKADFDYISNQSFTKK